MRVFVLGASGSGKSPLARRLAADLDLVHVKAGGWARRDFGRGPPPDGDAAARARFTAELTRFATAALAADPWRSVEHALTEHDLGRRCVIDGVRNPFDFVQLHDPRRDAVVWLDPARPALAPTAFEGGLDVIAAYLAWQVEAGLRDPARAPELRYPVAGWRRGDADAVTGATLDDAIDRAVAALRGWRSGDAVAAAAPTAGEPPGEPARVHAEIPPLALHVRDEYLYGMDPARVGGLTPCTAFVVSSYPGEAPTFQIRLPDGALFSYVPPTALVDPTRPGWGSGPALELADLAYHDCPDQRIVVHRPAALRGRVLAYFKRRDVWLAGDYQFTVEWWTGNQLLHAVVLDCGLVALLPHHKLKFGDGHQPGFAPYRKLRKLWKVGDG